MRDYWEKRWKSLSGKQKAMLYNPGNMLKREAILRLILKGKYTQARRILDVGGGLGDMALTFFHNFHKTMSGFYIILDISKNALKEAKKIQYFTCDFVQSDAKALPFKPEVFDIIICSEVLEHLDDLAVLKEMAKALSWDGVIIITIPYLETELSEEHLMRYDFDSLSKLCKKAGLHIKDILVCGRSIQPIRGILKKFFKRKFMGERESTFYSKCPQFSKFLVSILKPIDNIFVGRWKFPWFLKFLEGGTLVGLLIKSDNR
jgi:ubiquinone/menaquinone biosynthesis C-methylase UbiE